MKLLFRISIFLVFLSLISCTVKSHKAYKNLPVAKTDDQSSKLPKKELLPDKQVNFAQAKTKLNFRIINAYADIGGRDYVMDIHLRPIITLVNNNIYRLELTVKRDSNSSLRANEIIITHFYYDGLELIFFADKNRNQLFDSNENGKRYIISHTFELVRQNNKIHMQNRILPVDLQRKHVISAHKLHELRMQLLFISE